MPKESDFVLFLDPDTQLRIRFRRDRNVILEFLVQLETMSEGEWRAIVRYDSAHGRPHRDILNRRGREVSKQWLPGSFNDVRQDWRRYVKAFNEEA